MTPRDRRPRKQIPGRRGAHRQAPAGSTCTTCVSWQLPSVSGWPDTERNRSLPPIAMRASTFTWCISTSSSARYSIRKCTGPGPGCMIEVSPSTVIGAAGLDLSTIRTVTTASSGNAVTPS